ncbi:putative FAD/NAD(P)-binding domain-containing protein [Seiridium unicorne]|uniref:FAD/NAD(P)-binding domain-containing protein n=1 Tax=Seiridium unicorne TaxID=138068 RepID=A0ABR2URM6_9PEZI
MDQSYDLIVIGAGWFGLAAAKACIELRPDNNIAVLESAGSCGGTWAEHRLYPGLKSNNMLGTYEYPDFPMTEKVYGVKPNNHIPGTVLNRYLTDYARHFGFLNRVKFHHQVDGVESTKSGPWILTVTTPDGQKRIETAKLVLATGLTSTPNMPKYKGADSFKAPLYHAKEFCDRADTLKGIKNAVVVGGAKSAFDVAHACVEAGSTVDLVIRPDGHGPVWIAPPFVTPLKRRLDKLLFVRWMTWFSPCPWGAEDGYAGPRNFLHGTAIGRFLVKSFWNTLGSDVIKANDYDSHPELQKLKPWNSAFWIGSGLSILNYSTPLFDMVKEGKIRVHIQNIDHLEGKKVVLDDGTTLDADVMICSTGWKKESSLKITGLGAAGLSLPVSEKELAQLNQEADQKMLSMFPLLKDQPKLRFEEKRGEPLRLYRFAIPPASVTKRNLAFAGMISTVGTAVCASVQGLWISMFLDEKLDRLAMSDEEIKQEVMLHTQWGRWRYPCGYGASLPDFVFDSLPYVDLLLKDMGLNNHRKGGMIAELTSSYEPGDFAGLFTEWKEKHADVKS